MSSRLDLHEELCKILGSRNVYYNPPESVKMKYPAIVYSLNEYDNKSANSGVYLQWPGYNLTLIDKDPDSPIAQKLSVLQGCRLNRPPYPADGLYHFPFILKTTGSDTTKVFDEYYQKGYEQGLIDGDYEGGYQKGYEEGFNSAPPNYMLYSSKAQFRDFNVFNKSTVTLDLPQVTDYADICNITVENTTVEHLIVNGRTDGTITTARSAFQAKTNLAGGKDFHLKKLTLNCDFSKSQQMNYFISQWNELTVVDGIPIDFSSATGGIWNINCPVLIEMRIAPLSIKQQIGFPYSPNLSDETIQSIIDGLGDLTGQAAKTVSLHSTVINKLATEQLDQIAAKNWRIT